MSLLAGCHADEPVGPRLLRHLAAFLPSLPPDDPLLAAYQWWIVPDINPDGAERNRRWHGDSDDAYDVARYLRYAVRELPGDDIEFGFPHDVHDQGPRPENRAVAAWWRTATGPFALHVSLHSIHFAAGPWFLLEPDWRDRSSLLMERCATRTRTLGYGLHDVERLGEKGFERIAPGFCTRPNSQAMRTFFTERGDDETAARFRPSSMEAIRSLGGDALTLVSEMPLFITPGVGEILGPPDPAAERWRDRRDGWRRRLHEGGDPEDIRREARDAGLRPMPVRDQMTLQLALIGAGIDQVAVAMQPADTREHQSS